MKSILILIVFFTSLLGYSAVIPYNISSCTPELSQNIQIFTHGQVKLSNGHRETIFDVDSMMEFMSEFYQKIENSFHASKDLSLLFNRTPLCIGLFHDKEGPNAVAIGKNHVFFGLELIYSIQADWKIDGELGMKIVLAHEYAHIIQNRLGLKFNLVLPMLATKQKELQADCMAGVLLGFHLNDSRVFTESEKLLKTIGDHHLVGDHGTYEERKKSFYFGLNEVKFMKLRGRHLLNTTSQDVVNACSDEYPSYN